MSDADHKTLVRSMQEGDLQEADRIMRLAFGTFLGLPDPMKFMGDADFVMTRYKADSSAALVAEVGGQVTGSSFALNWGSVGVFGPLTVHPDYWNMGIARLLLEKTMGIFERWGTRHVGLFTFAQSSKHVHLYQKFGFWPRYLTAVMSKQVVGSGGISSGGGSNNNNNSTTAKGGGGLQPGRDACQTRYYSQTAPAEREVVLRECRSLTDAIYPGLDLRNEILSVDAQKLGDTILLLRRDEDDNNDIGRLVGIAVCHKGAGTEAGSGNCYIKFGAVRSARDNNNYDDNNNGNSDDQLSFDALLDACEEYARSENVLRIVGGVNMSRYNACKRMIDRGFKIDMQGVAMQRPNEPGYNLPGVFLIDDWR